VVLAAPPAQDRQPPFNDLRSGERSRASNVAEVFESLAFSQGRAEPAVPAAFAVVIRSTSSSGSQLYGSAPPGEELLAEANHRTASRPRWGAVGRVQAGLRRFRGHHRQELEGGRYRRRPQTQGYGAFITSTIFGSSTACSSACGVQRTPGVLLPLVHAGPAAQRVGRERSEAHRSRSSNGPST
jgi:hypothetical protein